MKKKSGDKLIQFKAGGGTGQADGNTDRQTGVNLG
jgi:hypothetical protein